MFCIAESLYFAGFAEFENVYAVLLVEFLQKSVFQLLRNVGKDPVAVFDLKERVLKPVTETGQIFRELRSFLSLDIS